MSEFNNSNIPILGGSNGHKAKAGGFQPMLLMRTVDEDGTVEPETRRMSQVMTEHGPQMVEQAVLGRSQYVTAEDLVEMIREVVREDLLGVYKELKDLITKGASNDYR